LLEIRLNELDPVIDYFVIIETTQTFTKIKKQLYHQEYRGRYDAFQDKTIHNHCRRLPGGTSEKLVKSQIMYRLCDNGVKVLVNSQLFAANFSLCPHNLYTICFIQSSSEGP